MPLASRGPASLALASPASPAPASTGIVEVTSSQRVVSAAPNPVHVPVHWPELTHFPLEQLLSSTQTQALWSELQVGAGESVVAHAYVPAGRVPLTRAYP
jgi:hypothetical protein